VPRHVRPSSLNRCPAATSNTYRSHQGLRPWIPALRREAAPVERQQASLRSSGTLLRSAVPRPHRHGVVATDRSAPRLFDPTRTPLVYRLTGVASQIRCALFLLCRPWQGTRSFGIKMDGRFATEFPSLTPGSAQRLQRPTPQTICANAWRATRRVVPGYRRATLERRHTEPCGQPFLPRSFNHCPATPAEQITRGTALGGSPEQPTSHSLAVIATSPRGVRISASALVDHHQRPFRAADMANRSVVTGPLGIL